MKSPQLQFRNGSFGTLIAIMCVALGLTCASTARAQSNSATLSGLVLDQNGAVVPGAEVRILNSLTGLQRQTTTSDEGAYLFPSLPPANYVVTVTRQGFAPVEIRNVVLNVGDQRALQIQLKAGNISAMVQIDADAGLINDSPAVGTVVDRQFVENIPLNGRSFQSLIALTPGIVIARSQGSPNFDGQFSVNGQRSTSNAFIVDGVSANFGAAPNAIPGAQTSGNLPGLTAFGTTQSLVSVDALQEFKIQTSGYAAEYGRQPGGQVSIATRSGTNDFHGSLFDYIRNDVFDANDWFANANRQPRPPLRQNDFGGTFSGPLFFPKFGEGGPSWYNGRNRTFFFFSYEGLRLRLPKFTLTNVPTLSLRQQVAAALQPILNSFPIPNGRDLGNGFAEFSASYSDPSTLDATSIRIDHAFNDKLTLFGRYNQAPSSSAARFIPNLSRTAFNTIKTKTLTVGLTVLRSLLTNEFRINYSDNNASSRIELGTFGGSIPVPRSALVPSQYDFGNLNVGALFSLPGLSCTVPCSPSVGFIDNNSVPQSQFNIVDNVSYAAGAHQFKLGVDFRRLLPTFAVNTYNPSFTYTTLQQVLTNRTGPSSIFASVPTKPVFTNFSAFVQDTWKLSRRLTLDLGVRWEVNPAPGEANGNNAIAVTQISNLATMQLAPRSTPLYKTTYNNLAPRIGAAYQLSQRPGRETVVRGGFGVFYDTGNDFTAIQSFAFPYSVSISVTNLQFPLDPSLVAPPPIPALQPTLTPPFPSFFAFDPDLKLPYTLQLNLSGEQSLGKSQVFTLSYVGATGRRLIQRTQFILNTINPLFTTVSLTTNKATSDYHALQAQFQRRLSRGLQALASYTWSHAIDEDSTSFTNRLALRGNADFDVRHNFTAAVTYDIPSPMKPTATKWALGHWSIDTTVHAQSALPVDIVASLFTNPADGTRIGVRPNLILGVPLYVADPAVPGGRRINRLAFSVPAANQSGSLGRNVLRGLPTWQIDFALRRQFNVTERLNLQFRAEAFNLFNHPNFGAIQTTLTAPNFGQATNMLGRQLGGLNALYQIGGPRSLQFALKLGF
jgi:hypothetical protein